MDGMGKGTKYTEIRKLTDNRFLNLFEMDALDNKGKPFHYYFASRNREEELPLKTGEVRQNGIVIYALLKEDPSRIIMIRQYRYPLDAWLYELPAWDKLLSADRRKELYREQKKSGTVVKEKKVGRNDPCPCGSGKKYKRCCGAQA